MVMVLTLLLLQLMLRGLRPLALQLHQVLKPFVLHHELLFVLLQLAHLLLRGLRTELHLLQLCPHPPHASLHLAELRLNRIKRLLLRLWLGRFRGGADFRRRSAAQLSNESDQRGVSSSAADESSEKEDPSYGTGSKGIPGSYFVPSSK